VGAAQLETVLPRAGGVALVLSGELRGRRGRLVEKHKDKEEARRPASRGGPAAPPPAAGPMPRLPRRARCPASRGGPDAPPPAAGPIAGALPSAGCA
jgi:hypothetical protein